MIKLVSAVLVLVLSSSGIYAQDIVDRQDKSPGFFVGVDYFSGETEINRDISFNGSFERELDHSGFRLKFGVQSKRNIRVQGYIKIEDLEDEIPLLSSNGKIYGIGGDVLIAFPLSQRFRPYALVGLSSDFAELNDPGIEYSEDFLNAISLKAGVGGLFRINDMLEFQVGYDIQYRTWQEIEVVEPFFGDVDVEQDDQSSSFHVGLNIFF